MVFKMFNINKLTEKFHVIFLSIFRLFGKEKERELQVKLAQIITNSADPEELKNKIVKEIAITLNACRCFFLEYDSSTNHFKKITNAYNTKRDSLSILGYDIEKNVPSFAIKRKYMKYLIIEDTERFIIENKLEGSSEDSYYKDYTVKSSLTVRLEFGEIFLGVLVVHYDNKKSFLQNIDLKSLKNIVEYISLALHLSTLYIEEKIEKEKERLLRFIISVMGTDYNLTQITQKIFEILAKIYNTPSVFIYSANLEFQDKNTLIDANIYELSEFDLIKTQVHYISDVHNFIIQNNLENSSIEEYFYKHNIKSLILLPILHENLSFGLLIMHFDKSNPITKDDLTFIKTVTDQLAIAVKQALGYEKEKKTAERESLLRKITETIRSTLDIDELFELICSELAHVYNIQRSFIVEFKGYDNHSEFDIKKEFKTSPEIGGLKDNKEFDIRTVEYWGKALLKEGKKIIIDNIDESDTPDYFKETYKHLGIKSIMGFAVKKGDDVWGWVGISEYNYYRHWTEDEISLLETISSQIYIAIKQAELYKTTKMQVEREALLRNITEIIRSSLDIDETLSFICEETAKLFNVQRTSVAQFPNSENLEDYIIKKEHKSSSEIRGITQVENFSMVAAYWGNILMESGGIFEFDNIEKSDTPDFFKNTYNLMGVKSVMGVSIKKGEDIWGTLILSEYNNYRHWTGEEKILIKAVANQVYIAINQAELYEKQKLMIERERIGRNIIEILRSSIDKTIIKKLFVKNIGKFFNAGRVLLSEYDTIEKKYLPADENSEYLLSSQEQSFIGYDWTNSDVSEYIQPLLEKRELIIYCWDEYIQHNSKGQGFIDFFEHNNIKSSYNFPIIYQQNIMGFFCIDFMNESRRLSDEDISRLRNMCTQAGVALYHAALYEKAQECFQSREPFSTKFLEQIKNTANEILNKSMLLSQDEFERTVQVEYLNTIINACHQLLELTKNISED